LRADYLEQSFLTIVVSGIVHLKIPPQNGPFPNHMSRRTVKTHNMWSALLQIRCWVKDDIFLTSVT
jgi:hypothetical protein